MHITIKKRKLKSLLHTLGILCVVFLVTIAICLGTFIFFGIKQLSYISPLVGSLVGKNNEEVVSMTKELCQHTRVGCMQVVRSPDGTIQIQLDNGMTALLTDKKDIKGQLASLQLIASQFTIKGTQPKRVDFRFAHVVVSF